MATRLQHMRAKTIEAFNEGLITIEEFCTLIELLEGLDPSRQ